MKRVLVVEDDAIMAFDLSDQLRAAGFIVVGPAIDAEQGIALVRAEGCDIAVLDVNLGNGCTSEPVAVELSRRSIPFVVVSGYSSDQHPPVFAGAPLVVKPVRIGEIIRILSCRWTPPPARS